MVALINTSNSWTRPRATHISPALWTKLIHDPVYTSVAKQDEFLHRNLHNTPAAICHSKCEEPSQGQRMALVELPPDDGGMEVADLFGGQIVDADGNENVSLQLPAAVEDEEDDVFSMQCGRWACQKKTKKSQ